MKAKANHHRNPCQEKGMEPAEQRRKLTDQQEAEEEIKSSELRNWSSLTEPLLHSILLRLDNLEDFFAFRGVCRGWRSTAAPSSASLPSQPPLILLTRCPSYAEAFYDISRERLYKFRPPWCTFFRFSIGYSHGFVITSTRPPFLNLLLWNLFTGARIRLPEAPEPFDRVLLSSNPSSPGCLIILFSRSGSSIQYCHVGDRLWKLSGQNSPRASTIDWSVLEDMIFFMGKLYALTNTEQLVEVDFFPLPKLTPLRAETAAVVRRGHGHSWLAECGGELLMVYVSVSMVFDVYRWDFGRGRWVEVCDLGGRALFMGSRGFAASIMQGIGRSVGLCSVWRTDRWRLCLLFHVVSLGVGPTCLLFGFSQAFADRFMQLCVIS